MSKATRAELQKLLELPTYNNAAEPGDYAEYFNEAEPEADIAIRRKTGVMVAIVPLDVWDHIRKQ